jgi:hypothetical protein
MLTETTTKKTTRNGQIDGVDVTVSFETEGNDIPKTIQVNINDSKKSVYGTFNYNTASRNFSSQLSNVSLPDCQAYEDIAKNQIREVLNEYDPQG